jgi:predicted amidohydrolase YtcJ
MKKNNQEGGPTFPPSRFAGFLFLFVALCAATLFAEQADLVLKNGAVTTMEEAQPKAMAVAIAGDKIVWVGEDSQVDSWIGTQTKVIDLKGAFVYPGLIDSHAHIIGLGGKQVEIDLLGTENKESIIRMVADRVAKAKKGEWIIGSSWDQNDWPVKEFPTRQDLDPVSPDNPVVLERIDGHAYWVNSAAIRLAGITAKTADPVGGKIYRDAQGNATGVFVDNAMAFISKVRPPLTKDEVKERIHAALQESARKGITMIHDAGQSSSDVSAFKELAQQNALPVRVYGMYMVENLNQVKDLDAFPENFGPYYEVRAIKMYIDGAMGSRGAALLSPYSDDPQNSGLVMWNQNEMVQALQGVKKRGIQACIHAIGDKGNRMVLDAYEQLGVRDLRWRIEHVQMLALSDVPRFTEIGVIASMQPTHATSDMPWTPDRIGPERMKGSYAWRSLLEQKTIIAGGSDAPVEDINPLWGLYSAITRQDHKGQPEGGWLPHQKVTRMEALRMFTIDAAYAAFREKELGSIKAGKLADLIVLPQDLLTCEPKAMIDMQVLYTIVGGKIRYARN